MSGLQCAKVIIDEGAASGAEYDRDTERGRNSGTKEGRMAAIFAGMARKAGEIVALLPEAWIPQMRKVDEGVIAGDLSYPDAVKAYLAIM